ncbi:N-acetyltransferase [Halobacillus salinus]|uniref:N-acetyltransferase n=2 Tax=Halobacillus salinus TaxID=192814 RepID=A0A4Z0H7E7_9BACI|nr:N-acetyltransferase [Halobacillus salinus]
MVPDRGDEYFEPATFSKRHDALLEEQAEAHSYFYLIIENRDIVGRINVVDIDPSTSFAHIGYRIGKRHTRKGIALKAMGLVQVEMVKKGIKGFYAKTTTNNIPSQKVLERSGFMLAAADEDKFDLNGEMVSFLNYTLKL